MRRFLLVTVIAVIALTSIATAFDGKRKGFVIGGGLGLAPLIRVSVEGSDNPGEYTGAAANLMLGYSWDEQNMIVYEGNVAARSENSTDLGQGFDGAVWYHYFGPKGRTFFSAFGLGQYYYKLGDLDPADPKLGVLLGGGYEFARHFQVTLYLSTGKTRLMGFDLTHTNLSVVVNAIAF